MNNNKSNNGGIGPSLPTIIRPSIPSLKPNNASNNINRPPPPLSFKPTTSSIPRPNIYNSQPSPLTTTSSQTAITRPSLSLSQPSPSKPPSFFSFLKQSSSTSSSSQQSLSQPIQSSSSTNVVNNKKRTFSSTDMSSEPSDEYEDYYNSLNNDDSQNSVDYQNYTSSSSSSSQDKRTTTTTTTTSTTSTSLTTNRIFNSNDEKFEDLGNGSFKISNYNVKFPYKPYACQASMMAKILVGLDNRENCLLESPTGTGKTLSLLCSTLEWQSQHKLKRIQESEKSRQLARESKKRMEEKKKLKEGGGGSNTSSTPPKSTSTPPPTKSEYEDMNFDDEEYLYKGLQTDFNGTGINKFNPTIKSKKGQEKVKKIVNELKEGDDEKKGGEGEDDDDEEDFKPKSSPTIFFCSRTHSQIKQLTGELNKTPYRPNMVVLASRDHYCINPILKDVPKKKEKCVKLLLDHGCRYNKKNFNIPTSKKFKSDGKNSVWDIEDLMKEGSEQRECPFFVSKEMIPSADLIFCPYNYLIDPSIRRGLKDKVKDAIIIFDEAHNIEDALMDASSFETTLDDLIEHCFQHFKEVIMDVRIQKKLSTTKNKAIEFFFRLLESLISWINKKINSLKQVDFEKHQNVWKGSKIIDILSEIGIDRSNYHDISDHLSAFDGTDESEAGGGGSGSSKSATNGGKVNADGIPIEKDPIPVRAVLTLESLDKVVCFIFKNENWIEDYRLVLIKNTVYQSSANSGGNSNKRHQSENGSKWNFTFGIWAMSPRIAFSSLSKNTRSVILTSGTLSPLYSFPMELASKFPISAEMGNLQDIKNRAWIGTIAQGPDNTKLICTHGPSEKLEFQDSLGETILSHIKLIPSGVLCFFPSYGFLEKVLGRWDQTGLLRKINDVKTYFYEPKNQKHFNETLAKYRESITEKPNKGAILFAVCRGKVSEGIDFSDEYARGVIVVGIPFPSLVDLRIILKKQHNDDNKLGVSGSDWYRLQAYRALNQALGRCIRHKNDYGSILLIDERFTQERNWDNLSKWTRSCIKNNKTVNSSLSSLKLFYDQKKLN